MKSYLNLTDLITLSPLLIVLSGALLLLVLESINEKVAKKYSFAVAAIALIVSLGLTFYVPSSDAPALTRWIRFDFVSTFFTAFFLLITIVVSLLSLSFFDRYQASLGEYYFLLLSATLGLILIAISADFLTLFLGIETSSLSIYVLAGYMKNWKISQEAAIKYFFIGSLAASFLIYGIAFIYGATGSTSFDSLLTVSPYFPFVSQQVFFLGGIALIIVGLSFKAAIVPFHAWAPDVYAGSPTPVVAFMAVGIKGGAFAALIRIFIQTFPQFNNLWNEGMEWLALITIVYGNFVAMRQMELRRFFAYSGISHAGFLLIPLVAITDSSLSVLLFYLVVYTAATLGSFAILEALEKNPRGVSFEDLRGLFHRSPLLGGVFIVCLLTLSGMPPLAGFFAKFYLFKLSWEAGYYILVIVALLASIFSAFYYLRIISIILSESTKESFIPPLSARAVAMILCATIFFFTVYPNPNFSSLFNKSEQPANIVTIRFQGNKPKT